MKKKKIIFIILMGIVVSGIVLMYSSFALFSSNQISKPAITIKVGIMNGTVKIDGVLGTTLTVPAGGSKTFTVTLENLNGEQGKFLFYYIGTLPTGVKFGYLEEIGFDTPPNTNGVILAKNGKQTYSLYVSNQTSSSININLGSLGGLSNQPLSLPSNGHIIEKTSKSNSNITNIWKYDQTSGSSTFCVTGEESTCQSIAPQETYLAGTIIKYKVNDSLEKYFHVMFDDGDTLTLQQRENTVYDTAWYKEAKDNSKGPITILPVLEDATSTWSNVLDQTYTLGSTVFKDNAFTDCSYDNTNKLFNCTANKYTLPERTAKARMITAQEISALGCTINFRACPVWMYNYLSNSVNYGGTVNQSEGEYGANIGYWSTSTSLSYAEDVWGVRYNGNVIDVNYTSNTNLGGRAVVKIRK